MPVDYIREKNKQRYMIWIFLVVLIVTGVVLWFGFFKDMVPKITIFSPKNTGGNIVIEEKPIEVNFGILENQEFQKMIPFDEFPALEAQAGRNNPFKSLDVKEPALKATPSPTPSP